MTVDGNHVEEIVLRIAAAMIGCSASVVVVVVNVLVVVVQKRQWKLVSMFSVQRDPQGVHVPHWGDVAFEVHHPLASLLSMLLWARSLAAAAAIVVDVLKVEMHHEPHGYHCIQKTKYSPLRQQAQTRIHV